MSNAYDDDLKILEKMNDEELGILADMLDTERDVQSVERKLGDLGSNTIGSAIFGNSSYATILQKVCDKMSAGYDSSLGIEVNERRLLEKVLSKMWSEMDDNERRQLLATIGKTELPKGQAAAGALIALFQAGGFESYKLAVIIANAIARLLLGRGLTLAANAALTQALGIVTGPLGIALTAAWTVWGLAGPAYKKITPAVIYIAAFRSAYQNKPRGWLDRIFG